MKTMLINLLCRLMGIGKCLFYIFVEGLKSEVVKILHDRKIQQYAYDAVVSAAKAGLKGDVAWDLAWKEFTSNGYVYAKNIARNVLETVLQNAYNKFKNS